ncbi:RnfH family protein [Solimonas variicoloris]|uniref:RnfH family protein n=1 Tax=Solimonas variicoloris TaxID=254408 RepID=UPI0003628F3C|nr:RnfH family protein [Solimonas variicoloris]
MRVEIAYALPDRQLLLALDLAPGTTAAGALAQSGLVQRFAGIDPATAAFGVFGRRVEATQILQPGDRLEIYRPLQADPKEARRERVRRTRAQRGSRR